MNSLSTTREGVPREVSKKGRKKNLSKREELPVITTILGARKSETIDESSSKPQTSAKILAGTDTVPTPSKEKHAARASEPVQLLRPPTDSRDASVSAVNILDSRYELARDLAFVERALIPTNTVFRVFGAIGCSGSGKSSTLSAVTTTTRTITEAWPAAKPSGLDIFVHSTRRLIFVDFPSANSSELKKVLEPPVFASHYRDTGKLYDLRIAFTALVTCSVLFVCVGEESDENESIFQVLKAAASIAMKRGWPCAKVVLIRNMVKPGQAMNTRRIQADERLIRTIVPWESISSEVIHLPVRNIGERESLDADRRLARSALSSFAIKPVKVPVPSKILNRCTETEWLTSLVYVFNETKTQPFFVAGEDVGFLRS